MATWPSSLPNPLIDGYSETLADNVIRTSMDYGAQQVRKRTSSNSGGLELTYLLTEAQLDTLRDFYEGDAGYGSIAFDFTHPRTAETVSCRFKTPLSFGTKDGKNYRVAVSLEVLA